MSYFDDNYTGAGGWWRPKQTTPPRCNRCGETCKWRIADGGGWRLFDLKKQHPGNRYVLHDCGAQADVDEFEVVK